MTTAIDMNNLQEAYQRATSRLVALDYDGTLVPFALYPELARPTPRAKLVIKYLADDHRNKVILTSGRAKENMDDFFADLPVILIAEHGAYIKESNRWEPATSHVADWIPCGLRALNALKFKYEGSSVELKSLSIAWHYRPISDKMKPGEMTQIEADLRLLAAHEGFLVYHSEDTIELRARGFDKGSALARWLNTKNFDFIMAIGDSLTDEDLFKALPETAFAIKVGKSANSMAQFHVESQRGALHLLERLAETESLGSGSTLIFKNQKNESQ